MVARPRWKEEKAHNLALRNGNKSPQKEVPLWPSPGPQWGTYIALYVTVRLEELLVVHTELYTSSTQDFLGCQNGVSCSAEAERDSRLSPGICRSLR